MDKSKAVLIHFYDGNLETAVKFLIKMREKGENVYIKFNGHNLYSADVTMDSAYQIVTKHTKEEFEAGKKKIYEDVDKEIEEATDKIRYWVERGKKVIPRYLHKEWVAFVFDNAKSIFAGEGIEESLEIMELLHNNAPVSEAEKLYREKVKDGVEGYILVEIVGKYSERGKEFAVAALKIPEIKVTSTLEKAVNDLLEAKKQGKKAFADFDGHILLSENVTMDSAFMDVFGLTKEEFDKKKKKDELDSLKQQYREVKRGIKALPELVEKGRQYIYPQKFEEWEKAVYINIMTGYGAFVVEDALKIMDILENSTMEEAFETLKVLDQNHSGGSMGAVERLLVDFAKKGPEFVEMIKMGRISAEYKDILDRKKAENDELKALNAGKNL